jgi:putative transposase
MKLRRAGYYLFIETPEANEGKERTKCPGRSVEQRGRRLAQPPGKRPKCLAAEQGVKRFNHPDTVAGRRRMVERLDRRAVEEEIKKCGIPEAPEDVDARCSHLRRGWYWGSQEFARKLRKVSEKLMKERKRSSRAYRRTPQVMAHSEEQARRWLTEGLKSAVSGRRICQA